MFKIYKSILSICLIELLLVMVIYRPIPVSANPLVLAPEVYYVISAAMAGGGLYAANKDSVDENVQTYWEQANDSRKHQWVMLTAAGLTAGKVLLDGTLMSDIDKYLESNYTSGTNVKHGAETYTSTTSGEVINTDHVYIGDKSLTHGTFYNGTYNDQPAVMCDMYLNGEFLKVFGLTHNMGTTVKSIRVKVRPTDEYAFAFYYTTVYGGVESVDRVWQPFNDAVVNQMGSGTINKPVSETHTYTGDSEGFGKAVDGNGGTMSVNIPPMQASTLHRELRDRALQDWLDKELSRLNREENPTLDDSTQLSEGEQEWDWYEDVPDGDVYKVPKGDPPRESDDKKFGKPVVPIPIPDLTPNDPTPENPDDTVVEHPPDTTTVDNGDGTSTTTTTQDVTRTSTSTDPQTGKKTTTKTTTTTTTKTITRNDTGEIVSTETSTKTKTGDKTTEDIETDTDKIDWDPLRRGLYEATKKFPFSLPWDLYNSIKQFDGSSWDGKVEINVNSFVDFDFDIDFGMFKPIIDVAKKIEVMLFDIMLILATRRLMGGGV